MTYELAKKLKDAGFPLIHATNDDWSTPKNPKGRPVTAFQDNGHWLIPTLSELIEACGKSLTVGNEGRENWVARCGEFFIVGSSPEEVVAKLWLALNKK